MIKPKCLIAAVVLTATMGSAHAVPVSGSFEGIITSVTDPYGLLVVLTGGHRSEGFPQYSGPHISGTFGYLTETLSPASCDVGYGSPCTFTATAPSGFQGSWQITGWGQSGTVVGDFFSKIMVTQGGSGISTDEQGFEFRAVGNCIPNMACDDLDVSMYRSTRGPNSFPPFTVSADDPLVAFDWTPTPTESQNGPGRASFSACRDASVIGYRWRFKPSAEGWDGS